MDWPRFPHPFTKIAERGLGINGRLYLESKRGYECRNFGLFIRILIAGRYDSEDRVFPAAIRAKQEGRLGWQRIYIFPPQSELRLIRFACVKHCIFYLLKKRVRADSLSVRKKLYFLSPRNFYPVATS